MTEPTSGRVQPHCCTEWPECSHVFAEYAQRHRDANPGCTCLTCMDVFEEATDA